MIKMHYAKGIDLSQGIEELNIKSMIDLKKFIKDIVVGDNKETVYEVTFKTTTYSKLTSKDNDF